jgi:hypothetical protein
MIDGSSQHAKSTKHSTHPKFWPLGCRKVGAFFFGFAAILLFAATPPPPPLQPTSTP